MKSRQSGFTLVELLIVIVVIAILVAISVVAYSGMQQRAALSSVSAYVSNSLKLLALYKNSEGSYPAQAGCIGSGYIDRTGTTPITLDCRWNPAASTDIAKVNPALNTELGKYGDASMIAPTYISSTSTYAIVGGYYTKLSSAPIPQLDGNNQMEWFIYSAPGPACPIRPVAKSSGGWPNFVTDQNNLATEVAGGNAMCWIPLK